MKLGSCNLSTMAGAASRGASKLPCMIGDGFEMSLFASSENTGHGWDLGT